MVPVPRLLLNAAGLQDEVAVKEDELLIAFLLRVPEKESPKEIAREEPVALIESILLLTAVLMVPGVSYATG